VNFRPGIPRYLQIADAIRRELKSDGERPSCTEAPGTSQIAAPVPAWTNRWGVAHVRDAQTMIGRQPAVCRAAT